MERVREKEAAFKEAEKEVGIAISMIYIRFSWSH